MQCYVKILVSDLETTYISGVDPHIFIIFYVFIRMTTGTPTSLRAHSGNNSFFFWTTQHLKKLRKEFTGSLSLLKQRFFNN